MARKKRDTYLYQLKDSHTIEYIGITNNPDRRVKEHERNGLEFTHMRVVDGPMTRPEARRREAAALKKYRSRHGGENPWYNETDDG